MTGILMDVLRKIKNRLLNISIYLQYLLDSKDSKHLKPSF